MIPCMYTYKIIKIKQSIVIKQNKPCKHAIFNMKLNRKVLFELDPAFGFFLYTIACYCC